jgi:hypothetical protein
MVGRCAIIIKVNIDDWPEAKVIRDRGEKKTYSEMMKGGGGGVPPAPGKMKHRYFFSQGCLGFFPRSPE